MPVSISDSSIWLQILWKLVLCLNDHLPRTQYKTYVFSKYLLNKWINPQQNRITDLGERNGTKALNIRKDKSENRGTLIQLRHHHRGYRTWRWGESPAYRTFPPRRTPSPFAMKRKTDMHHSSNSGVCKFFFSKVADSEYFRLFWPYCLTQLLISAFVAWKQPQYVRERVWLCFSGV